jgi:hypothetical protein
MKAFAHRPRPKSSREAGQVMVILLLGLGIFLIGALAFAVDLGQMWFARQSAQTAADAACTAGAMDLLTDATNGINNQGHFTAAVGARIDCVSSTPNNSNTNPAPCVYAALNGFNSNISPTSTGFGNSVVLTFPGSLPGIATPPSTVAAVPFMRVDVKANLHTIFGGMLGGLTQQTVRAFATCGVAQNSAPIPIVILDPTNPPHGSAFDIQGNPPVRIYGGPSQSIQVNSNSVLAANIGGSAVVDLTLGGPSHNGSSMGVETGGPSGPPSCGLNAGGTPTSGFCTSNTGQWIYPSPQIKDPYELLYAPDPATMSAGVMHPNSVAGGTLGCPAPAGSNCDWYTAGTYLTTNVTINSSKGICVGSNCGGSYQNYAIFDPGVYYLDVPLQADSNSCLRNSTNTGDGSGGVMFYLANSNTVNITSNSGAAGKCASTFNTQSGTGSLANGVGCPDGTTVTPPVPSVLPATLTGNVLLAPCTGPYGDAYLAAGLTPPAALGTQRGILFFQDRHAQSVTATAQGGGTYIMAGTMYFHSCKAAATAGTQATNCDTTSGNYYLDTLQMGGGSGSSTYVLGQIIVDNLALQGSSSINMDLNPSSAFTILKASLYQ